MFFAKGLLFACKFEVHGMGGDACRACIRQGLGQFWK